jgi:hypothetical protein
MIESGFINSSDNNQMLLLTRDEISFQTWLNKYNFSTNFRQQLFIHVPRIEKLKDLHLIIIANPVNLKYIKDRVSDKDYTMLQFYKYQYKEEKARQGFLTKHIYEYIYILIV